MGNDLDALFWRCRRQLPLAFWGEFLSARWQPDLQALFGASCFERAGDGYWQPVPHRGRTLRWGLVMAVRTGNPWGGDMAEFGLPPWVRMNPATGAPTEASSRRMLARHAVCGPEILDLLLLPGFDLEKPPLRLTGMAPALGAALDCVTWQDRAERPVLVVENVQRWLAQWTRGACLPIGSPAERAAFLRGLTGGIHTESVAHGLAVKALMQRPAPPLPEISVAVAEGAA